jgi:hypothetical protein
MVARQENNLNSGQSLETISPADREKYEAMIGGVFTELVIFNQENREPEIFSGEHDFLQIQGMRYPVVICGPTDLIKDLKLNVEQPDTHRAVLVLPKSDHNQHQSVDIRIDPRNLWPGRVMYFTNSTHEIEYFSQSQYNSVDGTGRSSQMRKDTLIVGKNKLFDQHTYLVNVLDIEYLFTFVGIRGNTQRHGQFDTVIVLKPLAILNW